MQDAQGSAELERLLAERGGTCCAPRSLLTGSHQDGEDLLQAGTGAAAAAGAPDRGNPEVYLRRTLYHLAADGWRRQGAWRRKLAGDRCQPAAGEAGSDGRGGPAGCADAGPAHAPAAAARGDRAALLGAADAEAETAAALGCSEGTVKSAASRGLQADARACQSVAGTPRLNDQAGGDMIRGFEELVRDSMEWFTGDVQVPADLAGKARRVHQRRRRLAGTAVLAFGTAAVIAAAVIAATGLPGHRRRHERADHRVRDQAGTKRAGRRELRDPGTGDREHDRLGSRPQGPQQQRDIHELELRQPEPVCGVHRAHCGQVTPDGACTHRGGSQLYLAEGTALIGGKLTGAYRHLFRPQIQPASPGPDPCEGVLAHGPARIWARPRSRCPTGRPSSRRCSAAVRPP